MITRYVYIGKPKDPNALTVQAVEGIENISLFYGEGYAFLYFETELPFPPHDKCVKGEMIPFPDGESWQRMADIYHMSEPQSRAHWTRRHKDRHPTLRVVFARPEMLSRYIFYHYQLQEERPKPGMSKYVAIYLFGFTMVIYEEDPHEGEDDPFIGSLSTHNTPADWSAAVGPCFAPWKDGYEGDWRHLTLLGTENMI